MWIKFLLNLKGNLNIKGKCFSNSFLASAKVRTLEKRVGDIYWIQMYPVFSSLVYKEHFDLWIKGSITKDLQVSYPIMLNLQSKTSIFLEFIVFPCFFLFYCHLFRLSIAQYTGEYNEWHHHTDVTENLSVFSCSLFQGLEKLIGNLFVSQT